MVAVKVGCVQQSLVYKGRWYANGGLELMGTAVSTSDHNITSLVYWKWGQH